jgi:hypothetical protein
MSNVQHLEDTKYLQWQDGMYVMLDELSDPLDEQGYVLALVEDSLRDSVYFKGVNPHCYCGSKYVHDCMGVYDSACGSYAGYWDSDDGINVKLTRAQALYIATGDTDI